MKTFTAGGVSAALWQNETRLQNGQEIVTLSVTLDRRYKEAQEQLATLAEQFARLVWEPIPVDAKAAEAPAFGQTLWEYAPHARALEGVKINSAHVGGYQQALVRLLREVG